MTNDVTRETLGDEFIRYVSVTQRQIDNERGERLRDFKIRERVMKGEAVPLHSSMKRSLRDPTTRHTSRRSNVSLLNWDGPQGIGLILQSTAGMCSFPLMITYGKKDWADFNERLLNPVHRHLVAADRDSTNNQLHFLGGIMALYYIERWMGGSIWAPEKKQIIKTGLTLEEAQAWCRDPETSSFNCTSDWGKALTEEYGVWMDTYGQHDPDNRMKVKFGGLSKMIGVLK